MDAAERARLAQAFLSEAVFASREKSAGGPLFAGAGGCGLGERAQVALDLTPQADELARKLWPSGPAEAELARIRELMSTWVERQDALDRKRNHFLKDFRTRHGFDRNAYSRELAAQFDAGLAEINAEVARRRAELAAQL